MPAAVTNLPQHSSLTGPTLVASTNESQMPGATRQRGYYRAYRVHARGGRCQMQRVRVHIRYFSGSALWLDYRQTYYEFFRFSDSEASVLDTHDFDVMRDGWRHSLIDKLVQRQRTTKTKRPVAETRLVVKKQFVMAPAEVHEAPGRSINDSAEFGCLTHGPSGPSRTRLRIDRGDGSWHINDSLPVCPSGYTPMGHGAFTTDRAFRTFEHYDYRFALIAGRLTGQGAYRPVLLRAALL